MSDAIIRIEGLRKAYANGVEALKGVDLDIRKGEILALLGPNGAGKTTLINIVCGIVTATGGEVLVDGKNWLEDFRRARTRIGLVPQELTTDAFESVWATVCFSRGLFGKPRDDAKVEELLRALSLWDKRDAQIRTLSGGMKRRVLIANALAHEPDLLFLDEPTAGVDVELRRDMWKQIEALRTRGTTIILTTHYIEEAESMADRVGIIRDGRILMVDEKAEMMKRLGRTEARIALALPLDSVPDTIARFPVTLAEGGAELCYRGGGDGDGHHGGGGKAEVAELTKALVAAGIDYTAIDIRESSLEDIFVDLVEESAA